MIAAIPLLWRYLGGALILALIVSGIYFKGRADGKEIGEAKLAEQRATWQQQFDRQSAATAKLEEQRDQLKWRIENDLQPKLASATADADDLAGKLRQYRARRCSVPAVAGGAPIGGGAGGVPADGDPVEAALGEHLGACARDAERLTAWQEFWRGLSMPQE